MKVKTVVIVNDFNYIQGGASKVAIDTARLLAKENIKVYFFSAVNKKEENIENVEYVSTNQNEALKEKNKIKGALNGIYNLKARKEFKKLLKTLDNETTIIHIHGWTKALSSSVFDIAFKMKFKVVLTLHDYFTACPNGGYFNYKKNEICHLKPLSMKCVKCNCDSRNYGFKLYRIIRQFVQNKIVKLNDKLENVISISEFSEKILKPTLGKNTKITRIYNPIDIDENAEIVDPSKNEYYLYVGRISKEKGVDLFCEAITELGYKGVVVGDGDEKEKLEKQYPNIEFTGWKNKDEVKQYMKGARALIFPSRWYEGAPLTPLEAMQYGIPCIASDVSAAVDYTKMKFKLGSNELLKSVKVYENNIKENSNIAYNFYINRIKQNYIVELTKLYNKKIGEKMDKNLKKVINEYKKFYKEKSIKKNIYHYITKHPNNNIKKAIICSIKYRYYKKNNKNLINKIKMIFYGIKNNKYVNKYNLEIYGTIGRKLRIYHYNIVVNYKSIIGDNVIMHGNNCIGNDGKNEKCPIIGNNVDIGYGSTIIGNIKIADNIKIGANSVVTKDFLEEGTTIAGVPAKKIK